MTPSSRGAPEREVERELLRHRRKSRLIVWLLVGLPSVVLGGFALLSIVLFQKTEVTEARKELERAAETLAREAILALRETESALETAARETFRPALAGEAVDADIPLVARLLVLDGEAEIVHPSFEGPAPDEPGHRGEARDALVSLEEGKRLLLAEGNPHQAIEQLSRALDLSSGPARPEILLHLAVANERVGSLDEALFVYTTLLTDHPERRASDGVPWTIRARLGAARVQLLLGDLDGARRTIEPVLGALGGDAGVEQGAREHLLGLARNQSLEIANRLPPPGRNEDSPGLRELLGRAERDHRFLSLLETLLLPDLRGLLDRAGEMAAPAGWTYLVPVVEGERCVIGALPVRDEAGWTEGLLAYELDLEQLQATRLDARARETAQMLDAIVLWTDDRPGTFAGARPGAGGDLVLLESAGGARFVLTLQVAR